MVFKTRNMDYISNSFNSKETLVPLEPALFSLDGLRPRGFIHPLAPPDDALAIRRIRLRVTK